MQASATQVLPGSRIPTDGTVVTGQSHVNEAMLTGEVTPVLKQPGSTVIGGTLSLGGALQACPARNGLMHCS